MPRSQLITPNSRSVACMHGGLAPKRQMHGNDPFGPLIKTLMLAVAFLLSHASDECSVVRQRVNTFAPAACMNRTMVLLLVESISTWQYYLPLLVLIEEKGSMTIVNE